MRDPSTSTSPHSLLVPLSYVLFADCQVCYMLLRCVNIPADHQSFQDYGPLTSNNHRAPHNSGLMDGTMVDNVVAPTILSKVKSFLICKSFFKFSFLFGLSGEPVHSFDQFEYRALYIRRDSPVSSSFFYSWTKLLSSGIRSSVEGEARWRDRGL